MQSTNIDQSAPLPNNYPPAIVSPIGKSQTNKWSFGVLYVPYYSGNVYTVIRSTNYPPDPKFIRLLKTRLTWKHNLLMVLHLHLEQLSMLDIVLHYLNRDMNTTKTIQVIQTITVQFLR